MKTPTKEHLLQPQKRLTLQRKKISHILQLLFVAQLIYEFVSQTVNIHGATRREVKFGDETIRVYRTKPKPGQLKIEEIALSWNSDRMIASDREEVVKELLAVAVGKSPKREFSQSESFQSVQADSYDAIKEAKRGPVKAARVEHHQRGVSHHRVEAVEKAVGAQHGPDAHAVCPSQQRPIAQGAGQRQSCGGGRLRTDACRGRSPTGERVDCVPCF